MTVVRVRVCVAALLTATLAGCGVASRQPPSVDAPPVVPRPVGVEDPAPAASVPPVAACNPRASLRPRSPLPAAGRMPPGTPMAKIAARGRLIVGVSQTIYPFSFRDPVSGEMRGFDVDIAREMARAVFGDPNAVQFKATNVPERITFLQKGEVDIVVHTFTMTCARLQQIAFSTEYLTIGPRLLVKRGSGFRSIDDLGGRKVCASKGGAPLLQIQQAASRPIPVGAENSIDCLIMLQQGQVDAVCNDDAILVALAEQDPTTEVVGPRFSNDGYGIGISRGEPELVRFVNAVLERLRASGTWATIYRRWLSGQLGPPPPPPEAQYLD